MRKHYSSINMADTGLDIVSRGRDFLTKFKNNAGFKQKALFPGKLKRLVTPRTQFKLPSFLPSVKCRREKTLGTRSSRRSLKSRTQSPRNLDQWMSIPEALGKRRRSLMRNALCFSLLRII